MFTTELSGRVLLTVLLLGPIGGSSHLQRDQAKSNWARTGETKSEKSENRQLSSIEEPGILLPADDKYNFVGEDSFSPQSTVRSARGSPYPSTTIVSTNSYSIRPGGGSSSGFDSGSSVFINAKPLTIVTTGNGQKGQPQSHSNNKGNYDSSYNSPHSKNNDKSTVYVKNNCYGSRCPISSNKQEYNDDNKSYHYVMNKDVKQKLKRYNDGPVRRNGEHGDFPVEHQMTLSLPFRVEPAVSEKDLKYPYRFPNQNRNNRRVTRTSSTTPGWIKLQPIFPEQYDIFSMNMTRNHIPEPPMLGHNSQFSTRLGVELNPESFADRWGWGGGGDSHENYHDKGSGSRLPSWLQEVHSTLKGGPTRDSDNKNWVKLDPIPVAGVTISKWVPKGTPSSELPSTNWPTRDHRPNSNSGGFSSNSNSNPYSSNHWYDQIDNVNKLIRPPSYIPVQVQSHQGWGPTKQNQPQSSSWNQNRNPTNQWNDVIYPDGPTSATASWQEDKDLSKYPSSFTISTPSSAPSSWPSDIRRPATGSWSAERDRGRPQFTNQPYGGNRRQGPSSYPTRNINEDDSRWVLVSNSRKVSVSPHPEYSDSPKYRPELDKFGDFPFYYENPYGHRRGKDVKRTISKSNQDAAFNKINATLSSLTPVLSLRGSSTLRPLDINRIRSSSTTKAPRKLPAFMKPYAGGGRAHGNNTTYDDYENDNIRAATTPVQTVRKGLSINPVYAAVGAGMIPATMAAVLPMMLGRRRRDVRYSKTNNFPKLRTQDKGTLSSSLIYLDYDSHARSTLFNSKSQVNGSEFKKSLRKKHLNQT